MQASWQSLEHKMGSPWRSLKWGCLERAGVTEKRHPVLQTTSEAEREELHGLSLPSVLWSLARTSPWQLTWEPGARKWFPVAHSGQRQSKENNPWTRRLSHYRPHSHLKHSKLECYVLSMKCPLTGSWFWTFGLYCYCFRRLWTSRRWNPVEKVGPRRVGFQVS